MHKIQFWCSFNTNEKSSVLITNSFFVNNFIKHFDIDFPVLQYYVPAWTIVSSSFTLFTFKFLKLPNLCSFVDAKKLAGWCDQGRICLYKSVSLK